MKQYKKALLTIKQTATATSKQNKYTKIAVETEDEKLKWLCEEMARVYSHYIKPRYTREVKPDQRGKIPINYREWVDMRNIVVKNLIIYVEERIAEAKPEWQVIAERNGWIPPIK